MHTHHPEFALEGAGTGRILSGLCATMVVQGLPCAIRRTGGGASGARDRTHDVRDAFNFDMGRIALDGKAPFDQIVVASGSSVTAHYPLTPTGTVAVETEAVLDDLVGIADAQASCVMGHGDFVSGAVALDRWHEDESSPSGEGLARAELLRSEVSLPVFAVDAALLEHVRAHSRLRAYAEHVDPVLTLFRHFDGSYRGRHLVFCYLDYIRICLESVDWADSPERLIAFKAAASGVERQRIVEEGIAASVRLWFLAHAARIVLAHDEAPDAERDSYVWLADYHNAMVATVASDADCRCVLDPAAQRIDILS